MALYRLEFLISSDVDVTNGTTTVTLNDGQDVSSIAPGTAIFINNQLVEALSGVNVSPTQSTITLRYNWPFATVSAGRLVAFNTFEGLNTAITRLNEVINSVPDFTGATGQGLFYNDGSDNYSIKPISSTGETLIASATEQLARSSIGIDDYGLGIQSPQQISTDARDISEGGFYAVQPGAANIPLANAFSVINSNYAASAQHMLLMSLNSNRVFGMRKASNVWDLSYEFYTTENLTSSTTSLDQYTVATLPSAAANARKEVYVSDLTGGAAPCYSNGANWLRFSDNTVAN